MSSDHVTRRDFVTAASTLAAGAVLMPRSLFGADGVHASAATAATLNIACVGIGGMGMSNMTALLGENIVAVCDVDFPYVERQMAGRLRPRTVDAPPAGLSPADAAKWTADRTAENQQAMVEGQRLKAAYDKAAKYDDFRVMLAKQKNIDAVVVATPYHNHAAIAAAAMRMGKHVYVQKPLTYTVQEARTLAALAKSSKVVTQMGNQGHSMEGTRRIKEIVASGVLGPIRDVHVWTDRPVRYWAQGIPRPGTVRPVPPPPPAGSPPPPPPRWSVRTVENAVLAAMAANPQSPPPGLNWDLWLGTAPDVPYHPAYHPFSWRGWVDFGVSAIGDMGAHLIDQPFWALGLTYPTAVSSSSTMWGGPPDNPASYPLAMTTEYEFAARGAQPAVRLFWYDSGLLPPRPPFLPDDMSLQGGDGGGGVFVGERGILTYETYGNNPKVYPESVAAEAAKVPMSVPRIAVSHEQNWVDAIKAKGVASSPFEYAAPLTETMLLGVVALRAGQGKRIQYDGANMRITNLPDANKYLTRTYRTGWAV
jgi:predicted dehydrogenase